MIHRTLYDELESRLMKGKALMITGPRQVGKTTMIQKLINESGKSLIFLNGDDPTTRRLLTDPSTERIRDIIGANDLVFIDEAQRITNIGLTAKIITDQFPERQLIMSGSSAFEMAGNLKEPLTGRKRTFNMYPVTWQEWQDHHGFLKAYQDLENRLVYGMYPEVLTSQGKEDEVLAELIDSYLYKDIFNYASIRKAEVIEHLVMALAYQVSQEANYKELGDLVSLDPKTIQKYVDLLEQSFVLFRLPSFSKNLRNELKKTQKIYFYDNGIRNALIGKYEGIEQRDDIGKLWENFLVSERVKRNHYLRNRVRSYFWRTKQKQEIDYVEVDNGKVTGWEFKWNPKKNPSFSRSFIEAYDAETHFIHRDNFTDFLKI